MMRRWLEGWRLCRGLEPVIEYPDAYAAVLRLPGRDRELFTRTDDAATVDRLASSLPEETWLTVTTQTGDRVAGQLLAAGVEPFDERKTLMSIDLQHHPHPYPPPHPQGVQRAQVGQAGDGYRLRLGSDGPLEYVHLLTWDGAVAAHGMAAIVGSDAVMHDIQTDPAHRRRGLGSVVMGALAGRGIERGARTGLLMATTDGFHLYRRLGWTAEATMVTASGARLGPVRSDLGPVLAGG
ncbi:ribosomal protein S18 acetylase RimI-like enzyme [Kribbella aluminosa]|uniref:Ribosomal protein S18 acetylase RimI-like enzyme n=1 Tax=Kribbella aluminosa TaxID=416017 RepID=A0ABS4USD8_9ACTN|nr:GNAT family N-acetyltransferase [Kribbella aluminosa]MBP2354559.1 ribosomal protein S18 acetylase RimI-like enzyme [Kribbella aluminosa]